MKRTLILLLIFLILGGGTAWYLSQDKSNEKTSLVGQDRLFAVKNTDEIYKIFLVDRKDGVTSTLERKGGYWIHNGKRKARPNAIENLLNAIRRIEMKYKPADAAIPGIVQDLATHGIKVELYDKAGKNIKTYYVGGGTNDERGTHIIMEGSEQPYIASIPSWEGNIRHRFSLKGDEWWDRAVFRKDVEDIQSISIEYPKQKNKSFKVEKVGNNQYEVTPFFDITPKINRPLKAGSVEAYLVGFEKLIAEDFRNDMQERDSIAELIPFAILTLKDVKGNEQKVKFHPVVKDHAPFQDGKTGNWVLPDVTVERLYADINSGDFMMVQLLVFGKIFWDYAYFFE